jgi:hypothetical protein
VLWRVLDLPAPGPFDAGIQIRKEPGTKRALGRLGAVTASLSHYANGILLLESEPWSE